MGEAEVERRAGDDGRAEEVLREGLELLERVGDRSYYPTAALQLALCLYDHGAMTRSSSCARWHGRRQGQTTSSNSWSSRGSQAAYSRGGGVTTRPTSTTRAVALAETTDFYFARAWARLMLAETLALAGRPEEASGEAATGLGHYDAKGDVTGAARARDRLAKLGSRPADARVPELWDGESG